MHIERTETIEHVIFKVYTEKNAPSNKPTYEFSFTKYKFDDEPWVGRLDAVSKNGIPLSEEEGRQAYKEYSKYANGRI